MPTDLPAVARAYYHKASDGNVQITGDVATCKHCNETMFTGTLLNTAICPATDQFCREHQHNQYAVAGHGLTTVDPAGTAGAVSYSFTYGSSAVQNLKQQTQFLRASQPRHLPHGESVDANGNKWVTMPYYDYLALRERTLAEKAREEDSERKREQIRRRFDSSRFYDEDRVA